MTENILSYIAAFSVLGTNPVMWADLGLATVHAFAAYFYLKHEDDVPLAACAGLASVFYLVLACVHGFAN